MSEALICDVPDGMSSHDASNLLSSLSAMCSCKIEYRSHSEDGMSLNVYIGHNSAVVLGSTGQLPPCALLSYALQ